MSTEDTKEYLAVMLEHAARFLRNMEHETGQTCIRINGSGFTITLDIISLAMINEALARLDSECAWCGRSLNDLNELLKCENPACQRKANED